MKGYPTDNALVGCYVLGKTLGRSADLKVKNETHCFTLLLSIWLIWSELEAQPRLIVGLKPTKKPPEDEVGGLAVLCSQTTSLRQVGDYDNFTERGRTTHVSADGA
ncbi:hypothetical protein EVAR_19877_1 [Eumeta japonica]|uniref:Uncharacterized protein n=1 Tax=Eumeta variegata TaxID=151549 RepID=A0A4C1XQE9_EUMVA|nr:hypothetical protein EVAR_19877_1 [Eumeta japonica]